MTQSLQTFLIASTEKAAAELLAAYARIPEEKRDWSPGGSARSALSQFVECAHQHANVAETLRIHEISKESFVNYQRQLNEIMQLDPAAQQTLFEENLRTVIAAIGGLSDADVEKEIPTPWGSMKLSQIVIYPYWNMSYHLGQINYIASILGCLE